MRAINQILLPSQLCLRWNAIGGDCLIDFELSANQELFVVVPSVDSGSGSNLGHPAQEVDRIRGITPVTGQILMKVYTIPT